MSFNPDDDEEDDEEKDSDDDDSKETPSTDGDKTDPPPSEPAEPSSSNALVPVNPSGPLLVPRKLGKNPDVDTSFLRDREREEHENELREQLRLEWEQKQEALKNEEIEITFSYWDGSGHRRSLRMKKGGSRSLCAILRPWALFHTAIVPASTRIVSYRIRIVPYRPWPGGGGGMFMCCVCLFAC